MINTSKYSINTPEYKVAKYLNCLSKRAFTQMVDACQNSWINSKEGKGVFKYTNVPSFFKNDLYKYIELKKCEIMGRKDIEELDNPDIVVDVIVMMEYVSTKSHRKRIKKAHLFRVIKEDKDGNPSIHGNWGVNPISTMRSADV